VRVISWNLFHGRDAPPDLALVTWRSRLLRLTESNASHAQVNRSLLWEFATVLARDPWDLALLQEAPPRWLGPLCRRAGAGGASALTARNFLAPVRAWLADRNPDTMVSAEGGSNQLLVRPPWRIEEIRRRTLVRRPQRRRLLWARLVGPGGVRVCAATLHATASDEAAAACDLERAAEAALTWGGATPLILGGDLNLRPRTAPDAFARLSERFGLAGPAAPGAVDHILVRGLEVTGAPRILPAEWRELPWGTGLRLRLSDHAPVALELDDRRGSDAGPSEGESGATARPSQPLPKRVEKATRRAPAR
jgi:endonuclease/exonuclease/phosphatase family metal-dependent hydrolase